METPPSVLSIYVDILDYRYRRLNTRRQTIDNDALFASSFVSGSHELDLMKARDTANTDVLAQLNIKFFFICYLSRPGVVAPQYDNRVNDKPALSRNLPKSPSCLSPETDNTGVRRVSSLLALLML